jgi:4-amino-4-deoxy-L-arabinose transferase-like glycosyltransferase
VEVITSRSDTMDAVMMALIVLALLLLVRAGESGRLRWLLGAAAALGLAFDVKLLESIVALPALALTAYLALPGTRSRRLLALAAAGGVYVAVALAWLTATLLVPSRERPYAIGSSNGSAWNAAFVFNGTERLGGKSPEPQFTVYVPGRHYPTATQSERDKIPIVPASPTRLLARIGPLSGERLGLELLAALLLGLPALLIALRTRSTGGARAPSSTWIPAPDGPPPDEATLRLRRALAAGLLVWLFCGIVLFSSMERLHPRYVEAFVPAVAATLGIGAAWAVSTRDRFRAAVLAGTLAIIVIYAERLLYGLTAAWWVTLLGAFLAFGCAALAHLHGLPPRPRALLFPAGVLAATLVAVLAVPLGTDVTAIETHVTDAGYVGALPSEEQRLVSAYLRAHQDGARYELAAESATGIGSLIVQDARPVLVLTSYNARVFTSVAELRRRIAKGEVRYAFLNTRCTRRGVAQNPACSGPVRWVRAQGTDVSAQAGLGRPGLLWLLPGARA